MKATPRDYKILKKAGFTRKQIDDILSISDEGLLALPYGERALYEYAYQLIYA